MADTVIFLTSGTSWAVPNDWNNGANTIEVVGGGGGALSGGNYTGGGGGAYSKITNLSLTVGASVTYVIGAAGSAGGGNGGDTYFNGASLGASSVGAKGGTGGTSGGAGGAAGSGVGTVKNSGGNGAGISSIPGGGGGAGGSNGNGGNGADQISGQAGAGGGGGGNGGGSNGVGTTGGTVGGNGGNNFGGTGGGAGGNGANGAAGTNGGGGGGGGTASNGGSGGAGASEWTSNPGAVNAGTGGGGGGGSASGSTGGTGGLYGGGGGGCNTGGAGAQGIVVITYTPFFLAGSSAVRTAALIAATAVSGWSYAFVGGQQPYSGKKLNPAFLAIQVDDPPFRHRERTIQQQAIAAQASQPPIWPTSFEGGRQPYAPYRDAPSDIEVPVNNPPFGIPPPWLSTVTQSWQPDAWPFVFMGNAQPYQPPKISPDVIASVVNNPPFRHPAFLPANLAVGYAWQPDVWPPVFTGGRQPYSPRQLDGHTIGQPQDDPPFSHPGRSVWLPAINWQWQPDPWPPAWPAVFAGGRQAYAPARLHPSVMDVPVDMPPPSQRNILLNIVVTAWRPSVWPVVFIGGREAYEPRKLNPQITDVPVNDPPFTHTSRRTWMPSITYQWQPDPWPKDFMGGRQFYAPRKLAPGTPGFSVDPPPFRHRGRTPWMPAIIYAWQPPVWPYEFVGAWQPYAGRQLNPSITNVFPTPNPRLTMANIVVRCRIIS